MSILIEEYTFRFSYVAKNNVDAGGTNPIKAANDLHYLAMPTELN